MNKKAQQELVGFVLIVVIVTIIGIVFLALTLAKKQESNSIEVSNLLQATMYYTTECSSDYGPRQVEDLIREVNKNPKKLCVNRKKGSPDITYEEALEKALQKAMDESLRPGDRNKYRAYNLTAYYTSLNNNDPIKDIVSIGNGRFYNCSNVEGGMAIVTLGAFSSGRVNVELLVCKQ